MELRNLREFIEQKMQLQSRSEKKYRFKLATTKYDQLMIYMKDKYRSDIFNKVFTEQHDMPIYNKHLLP